MPYNIYRSDSLSAVCSSEMDAVMTAVKYYRESDLAIRVEQVYVDGSTAPYDWEKAYRELCNM